MIFVCLNAPHSRVYAMLSKRQYKNEMFSDGFKVKLCVNHSRSGIWLIGKVKVILIYGAMSSSVIDDIMYYFARMRTYKCTSYQLLIY